jgi:hypothetical protein
MKRGTRDAVGLFLCILRRAEEILCKKAQLEEACKDKGLRTDPISKGLHLHATALDCGRPLARASPTTC